MWNLFTEWLLAEPDDVFWFDDKMLITLGHDPAISPTETSSREANPVTQGSPCCGSACQLS